MIYPAGTDIRDIKFWDRSTKVSFACTCHPEKVWHSKQPSCSSWFPADETVPDKCPGFTAVYLTTQEYNDGR